PSHPLPLPNRVIGILNRQLRQRIGPALQECAVERLQLLDQHPHGPAVGNDVVHGDQQNMLLVANLDQTAANQRPLLEIEARAGLLPDQLCQLTLGSSSESQIMLLEMESSVFRTDPLHQLPLAGYKSGPQGFVPREDAIQGAP